MRVTSHTRVNSKVHFGKYDIITKIISELSNEVQNFDTNFSKIKDTNSAIVSLAQHTMSYMSELYDYNTSDIYLV